ncbi:glutathione peroxidase [Flavobacterium muglaense]|uniref:Glutathione peroxidase n=1 Tax=Flavobacterium muglaense TaxID=2764716 RepID=A0A923N191_9FLAO|nr:glutathione peroxidase [Flavobacterium muglaense]MBC5838868.1 glutathione peroxidase [Flavobacterium muglaense]MBC5845392.1 glutathione peroxidase [Flavobacterium muglaense]
MKNLLVIACSALLLFSCKNEAQGKKENNKKTEMAMEKQNIYQFKVEDLSGNIFDFASLKGKKVIIVNTASKCGLTPQYKDLEAIYKEYKDKGFVIVGFPANNFASQEPGTNEEIASFCQLNYGVTFPMMDKVSVKGDDMCAIYQFLTQKEKNGLQDSNVEWNFQKYLINENGELVKVIAPKTLPTDPSVVDWIKA